MQKIAIIGAGLAGLTLGKSLNGVADVTIFEKSRGFGGRMPTRYSDSYHFDHGAQFFTIRNDSFRSFLSPYIQDGLVQRWEGRFVAYNNGEITKELDSFAPYVCAPKMNVLAKAIAAGQNVQRQIRVARLEREGVRWRLYNDKEENLGEFDWVISAAPAQQSADLLPQSFSQYERVKQTQMLGCFTLMLGFEKDLELGFNGAFVNESSVGWIAVNSSKPGRPDGYALVINSTNDWAEAHIEDDFDAVKAHMISEGSALLNRDLNSAAHVDLHRWRYAFIDHQDGDAALIDEDQKLAACGDWCVEGRVEAAYESATALSAKIKSFL